MTFEEWQKRFEKELKGSAALKAFRTCCADHAEFKKSFENTYPQEFRQKLPKDYPYRMDSRLFVLRSIYANTRPDSAHSLAQEKSDRERAAKIFREVANIASSTEQFLEFMNRNTNEIYQIQTENMFFPIDPRPVWSAFKKTADSAHQFLDLRKALTRPNIHQTDIFELSLGLTAYLSRSTQ